jgi:mono/diheme cytochrome c family protein
MNKLALRLGLPVLIVLIALIMVTAPAAAQPSQQEGDAEHGKYLVEIIGCLDCHTPIDPTTFQPVPDMLGAGGYPFEVPNLGTVYTKNITSDKNTGLGDWTDEEIKTAITTGVSRDGLHLFPIMPYKVFNKMSEEDLNDIVAYLRTLPAINNVVERKQILPVEMLPAIPRTNPPAKGPDPSDTAERGKYLMTAVLTCGDCHTPLDPNTQTPIEDKALAGGQAYVGPWGTVYAGNITPDDNTGLGKWSDAEIERVMRLGVRPDGRQVILMPWQVYTHMTDEDMAAVINYLRNDLKPIANEVPSPEIAPEFVHFVPVPTDEATVAPAAGGGGGGGSLGVAIVAGIVVVVLGAVLMLIMRRRRAAPGA